MSRRDLLRTSALLAAGGLAAKGRNSYSQTIPPPADPTRILGTLPSELGGRSPFEEIQREVGRFDPDGYSLTPLERLTGIITPSDLHFERHHAAFHRSTRIGTNYLFTGWLIIR